MTAIVQFPMNGRAAVDEVARIRAALCAVADLLTPDGDIQTPQRDHIAILLDVLLEQLDGALARLQT
jgi:hypothetical protein